MLPQNDWEGCMVMQSNSHFESAVHGRNDTIFHPHILCNDGCHGLLDDDHWTRKIIAMDFSAISTA